MAEIIVGSYEDYVVGYSFPETSRSQLEQTFAVRAHSGSVRCLAASQDGSLALSVGFDEVMNLFGLKKRKLLQTSEGAINCAAFVGSSHLICGSEDSNIYIYECKASNMTLVKTLKGHKEAVTSLSVHSSGKVLLSVSKDNTMRTWNLIKGRCAYVTNINMRAHLVLWSKTGDEFVIAANNEIYLYNNSDSGKLDWYDLKTGSLMMSNEAHETRIKSIRYLGIQPMKQGGPNGDGEAGGNKRENHLLATMSSDGVLKIWSTTKPGVEKPKEVASESTGARLTCMTSVSSNHTP